MGSVVVADESRTLIGSVLGDKMFCVEIGMVSDDAVPAGSVNGDERLAARSWSGEAERAWSADMLRYDFEPLSRRGRFLVLEASESSIGSRSGGTGPRDRARVGVGER